MTPEDPGPPKAPTSTDDLRRATEARNAEMLARAQAKRKQAESLQAIDSAFLLRCIHNNSHGDGALFAAMHKGQYLFNKSTGEWLLWNGHHLELDIREFALSAIYNVAQKYHEEAMELTKLIAEMDDKAEIKSTEATRKRYEGRAYALKGEQGRKNALRLAADPMHGLDVTGDQLDADPWKLACRNGVLDLRTGELAPGKLEDYITKASPIEWHGLDAPAPIWERSLLEISADRPNIVEFLQRWFGYCCTGLTREQKFPVFEGRGRNGKGLIRNLIERVMGPLATPIPAEMLLDQGRSRSASGPSPDLMSLKGTRCAFASETDAGRWISASRVKMLTGSDSISARAGYDRYMTSFLPSHKLILMTNEKPRIPPDDYALWERILRVPFEMSYVDREPVTDFERPRDPDLEQKILAAELPGILAWLVRGCLWWQQDGLAPPPSILSATAQYRRDEDTLQDWIDACCVLVPDIRTKAGDLYASFVEWHETNMGGKTPTPHRFGKWMQKRFEKIKSGAHMYAGIKLA